MKMTPKFTQKQALALHAALKDLFDISGEATIPLESTKAVRQFGKFIKAREVAGKVLDEKPLGRDRQPPHTKPCNVCMGTGNVSVALEMISGRVDMRAR